MRLTMCCVIVTVLALPACKKNPPMDESPTGSTAAPAPATATAPAPEPASGYQGSEVKGGGTITGTVSYAGKETDTKVKITKDSGTCCDKCKAAERMAGAIVVNDSKLANVVVWLPEVAKGKPMDSATVTVNNAGCMFEPHVSIGYEGGMVAAKNSDPVLHNTHLFLQQGSKDLVNVALPNKGQIIEKKLKKPGIVSVKCDAHEWMQAYIFVATNPYATVTDKNGTFTLTDVPAGEYTAKIWHERLGEKEAKVKVEANGTAKLDITFS